MEAVDLTRRNAVAVQADVRVEHGDVADPALLHELDGTVDVLVANPPYIPPDAEPVDPEVRDHDPDLALYGGGLDGLDVPRAVLRAAARLLVPGGLLVMEHAEVQDAAAREAARATGAFVDVESRPDLTGRPRMLVARRSRPAARDRLGAVNERITPASDPTTWGPALDEAVNVLSRGGLVVLPTDTVYGIAADAFTPPAVQALLDAKGRGRQMPPPVLIARRAHARRPGHRRARGRARPRRGVLARRAHAHRPRPAVARVGPGGDARHGRAAGPGPRDRAGAAAPHRAARGLQREPHGLARRRDRPGRVRPARRLRRGLPRRRRRPGPGRLEHRRRHGPDPAPRARRGAQPRAAARGHRRWRGPPREGLPARPAHLRHGRVPDDAAGPVVRAALGRHHGRPRPRRARDPDATPRRHGDVRGHARRRPHGEPAPVPRRRLRQPATARRHRGRGRDRVRARGRRRHLGPRLAHQAHGPGAGRRVPRVAGRAALPAAHRQLPGPRLHPDGDLPHRAHGGHRHERGELRRRARRARGRACWRSAARRSSSTPTC